MTRLTTALEDRFDVPVEGYRRILGVLLRNRFNRAADAANKDEKHYEERYPVAEPLIELRRNEHRTDSFEDVMLKGTKS